MGAGDSPPTKATVQERTTRLVSSAVRAAPVPPPRPGIPRAGASMNARALGVAAVAAKARRRRAAAEAKAACWLVRRFPPVLPVVAAYGTRAGVVNSTVRWLARAALPASVRGALPESNQIKFRV